MFQVKRLASWYLAVPAMVLLIFCGGCGGGSSSSSTMSPAQAEAVSQQLAQALQQALQNTPAQKPPAVPSGVRPSLSAFVKELQPDQSSGCTPISTGQNCDWPVSYDASCPGGGTIAISGAVSGALNNSGGGSVTSQITVTPTNCSVSNLIINGDPSVTVGGQINFTNSALVFPVTLTESGGISYGPHPSGSCQLNVTYTVNSSLACTVSGTLCGNPVSGSC
jgi:hypothetical protein